ncbi:MAG: ATP-binding cassette domain-containing protein [Ignavibacteriae bacterium]|nr:ATP-binding cassette domain-containing protein [Ignavibacteria bacterium]MBI3365506.1 ATP-binding cassette domain-containing protein [Ignavibacteriota bacterium]
MSNAISPVIVAAHELAVRFGEQIVLQNAALSLHENDRIGLIGNNGSGKSTLLKILAGIMEPDSGTVTRRRDLVTGYLSQDFQLDPSLSVYENIVEGAHDVIAILREYDSLPFTSKRRHLLEGHIHHRDGWNLENRIEAAMHSLNAPEKNRDITTLSGGEKRRVALCKAIISRPDLLILDEPTNHLDTESIEWTEEFLVNYSGACLFVTHDRYFLDSIATRIVELAEGVCHTHAGNYTDFLLDKAERESQLETEEHKRNRFLCRELEWVRKGPRARRTKSKSRLSKYFEEVEKKGHEPEAEVELIIPPAVPLGSKILNLKHVGMKLGGKKLFGGVDFNFDKKRKLGIIGRNGLGKTTLLKIILGELHATEGRTEVGDRTLFNYVDQSRVALNDESTVLQEIGEGNEWIVFGEERLTVWKYLRRFLFADERMQTKVGKLSGGERSRLLLAKILKNGGNFLILDEPTNDLDLATLRVLEEALTAFDGCVIAVSHDRYFLNRVCNGILAFEGEEYVHFSEGDYDYYIEKRNARFASAAAQSAVVDATKPRGTQLTLQSNKPSKKLKWKEARELETIEQDILRAEAEVQRIEAIFSAQDFYEKHGDQTVQLTEDLAAAKEQVTRLYARWHELEELRAGIQ